MQLKLTLFVMLCCLLIVQPAAAAQPVVNISDLGAVADGKTLCTEAIQKAVDRCSEAGGGTVFFPPGTWLSGTIYLKNNITLYLEAGATLLGSANTKDYPDNVPKIRSYTDNYVKQSLIAGENLENIAIRGRGTINGQGEKYRWGDYLNRPYIIRLVGCRDVLVEDVHLRNSAMWMQHYLACDRVTLRRVQVYNHSTYHNDGVDIDGCHDVQISDCWFDSSDDALCLKSTLPRANENVMITNCVISSHCNAIKMGTESTGGCKNLTISNCTICSPRFTKHAGELGRGLAAITLQIVDGAELDRVAISNITIDGVTSPLCLRLGDRARPYTKDAPKPSVGSFRNVTINNIVATNVSKYGCVISGLPGHRIENVAISNIRVEFDGGGTSEEANRLVLPEEPEKYPDSRMFGVPPAYAFYVRHAKNVRFDNVDVSFKKSDVRPPFVFDDVEGLDIADSSALVDPQTQFMFRMRGVHDALIRGCRLDGSMPRIADLDAECRNIRWLSNAFDAPTSK